MLEFLEKISIIEEQVRNLDKKDCLKVLLASLGAGYICTAILGYSLTPISKLIDLDFHASKLYRIFYPILGWGQFCFFIRLSLIFIFCGFLLLLIFRVKKALKDNPGNTPYSAEMMNMNDLKNDPDFLTGPMETTEGILLGIEDGNVVTQNPDGSFNKNILVAGMAGTGKSTGVITPYIFRTIDLGESVISIDTKGDIYSQTVEYALENGYEVRVLNCRDPEFSDGWNVLGTVDTKAQNISRITDTIFDCLGGENDRDGDNYWYDSARVLLKALICYVIVEKEELDGVEGIDENLGTIARVYDILVNYRPGEMACEHLERLFDQAYKRDPNNPALGYWNSFNSASKQDNKNGIIQNLAIRLSAIDGEDIRRMLSRDDIDLKRPGNKRCLYYVNLNEQDHRSSAVASIFFRELTHFLSTEADRQDQKKLRVPVTLLLDEFGAIGKIPEFDAFISNSRSRDIRCVISFQNIAQIQKTYQEGAETIIANCALWSATGIHDKSTAQVFSEMIGEKTYFHDTKSVHKDRTARTTSYTESGTPVRQPLLSVSQIVNMKPDEILIYGARKRPKFLKRIKCWEMPQYRGRDKYKIENYQRDKEKF